MHERWHDPHPLDPDRIGALSGHTALITGGNSGIGRKPSVDVLSRLPEYFRRVPYVGARFPGSPGLGPGANCQLFAYSVLEHFGLAPPPLRSSELWLDTQSTVRVTAAEPLDLLLFNDTGDPWGAHVGVWIGDDQVLHLSAEVGRPAVWPMREFADRGRYRVLVGIKRVVASTVR